MYSQCGGLSPPKNCVYNGPAKISTDPEVLRILKSTCPDFVHSNQTMEYSLACCDILQLRTLSTQLQAARNLLQRCPGCLKNFINLWCQFTCSPNQSMFTSITDYGTGISYIADYYITNDFADGLFNSCRHVNFPGSNGKVLDLMCGTTADKCTPSKWLAFLGAPPNAPFQINSYISQTPLNPKPGQVVPTNARMIPCNATFKDKSTGRNRSSCSCQDCLASCPVPPSIPAKKKEPRVAGIPMHIFITSAVYLLFLILFVVYNIVHNEKSSLVSSLNQYGSLSGGSEERAKYGRKQPSFFVRCGATMEKHLRRFFQAWGTWCAFHPWMVIIASFVIVVIMSCGLVFFKVVTNPVKLWSAPGSTARQQKDYFDKHFGPFYRTEQVIITAVPRNETYSLYPRGELVHFNGIIHKDMLHKVLVNYVRTFWLS